MNPSEQVIDTIPPEAFEDEDDIVDAAVQDAVDVPEEYRHWYPDSFMVAILGHRGSGKTTLMARFLLNRLALGYQIYTNLELYPEKAGIHNAPKPLQLDDLLSFELSLQQAAIGIEELGTWVETMRAASTTNILLNKFFQLCIRKKGLEIFFTNQSPRLPGAIWEQIDLKITGQDLFYSPWAREEGNVAKGTTFCYEAEDISGIFTGYPGLTRAFMLRQANQLWNKFNSYQMFNPFQWAQKTQIEGQRKILNVEDGEIYTEGEEDLRDFQKVQKQYNPAVTKVWQNFDSKGVMDFINRHKVLARETDDRAVFKITAWRRAMSGLKGQSRKDVEAEFKGLMALAKEKAISRFTNHNQLIELAKPEHLIGHQIFTEANEQ